MSAPDLSLRQIELRLPHELRAAMAQCSVIYLPLGTYEWHGEHLPIGLDGLTAHGLCLRAAASDGGLVCPPLYYGTGGGHAAYPWTIMMESETEITAIIEQSLHRLDAFGVDIAVLFSGHFAPTQLEMIATIADRWNAGGRRLRVLHLAVNQAATVLPPPDHAGLFETSLLGAMWPDRVDITQLPPRRGNADPDRGMDTFGAQRHDPGHPLYGVFGADPRTYDEADGRRLMSEMVDWLVGRVRAATPAG